MMRRNLLCLLLWMMHAWATPVDATHLTIINQTDHTLFYDIEHNGQSLLTLQSARLLPHSSIQDALSNVPYRIDGNLNVLIWFNLGGTSLSLANIDVISNISSPDRCQITIDGIKNTSLGMPMPTWKTSECFSEVIKKPEPAPESPTSTDEDPSSSPLPKLDDTPSILSPKEALPSTLSASDPTPKDVMDGSSESPSSITTSKSQVH